MLDDHGNHHHLTVSTYTLHAETEYFDVHEYPNCSDLSNYILDAQNPELVSQRYKVQDLELILQVILKPFFAWAPKDTIKRICHSAVCQKKSHL
jgi:hypothetical protein